jgi:uncharacterized protein (TIGR02598 family)
MKRKLLISGFSLVEVTLALGVAAFCLVAVLAMLPVGTKTQRVSVQQTSANGIVSQILTFLRADVRLPPGQANKIQGEWQKLSGHWRQRYAPDTLFFTNDGQLSKANSAIPADAAFRAIITYRLPPTETTSLADITVSWPAQVDPTTGAVPEGSVETLVAVNR